MWPIVLHDCTFTRKIPENPSIALQGCVYLYHKPVRKEQSTSPRRYAVYGSHLGSTIRMDAKRIDNCVPLSIVNTKYFSEKTHSSQEQSRFCV